MCDLLLEHAADLDLLDSDPVVQAAAFIARPRTDHEMVVTSLGIRFVHRHEPLLMAQAVHDNDDVERAGPVDDQEQLLHAVRLEVDLLDDLGRVEQ